MPGDMYGTVKFVGPTSKQGKHWCRTTANLLPEERMMATSMAFATGPIFLAQQLLPVHREKRPSPARPRPATSWHPFTTPSQGSPPRLVHSSMLLCPSFSPWALAPVLPVLSKLKSRRPSPPRPESPFRKQPNLVPTCAQFFYEPEIRCSSTLHSESQHRLRLPQRFFCPYSRTGSRAGNPY